MASFVPTFEEKISEESTEISTETPESKKILQGEDLHFIFVVDRSGSMDGIRMELTREALNLFVQSLPIGCTFSIISFGT